MIYIVLMRVFFPVHSYCYISKILEISILISCCYLRNTSNFFTIQHKSWTCRNIDKIYTQEEMQIFFFFIFLILRERLGTRFNPHFQKNLIFFFLKFNIVCTFWIVLMCWYQKWFLKNKKNHWHVFWHEKLFKKQPRLHCQTSPKKRCHARQSCTVDWHKMRPCDLHQ